MKLLKKISRDLKKGENVETYITVLMAIVLSLVNFMGNPPQPLVLTLTVTILGLLAFSILRVQHRLEEYNENMKNSNQSFLLKKFPDDYEQKFHNAKDVWLVGFPLNLSSNFYSNLWEEILKGTKLNVLTLTPNSDASVLAARQIFKPINQIQYNNDILTNLHIFCNLKKEFPEKVQIKTIEKIFSFGFRGFNLDSNNGIIYIIHYSFRSKFGDVPKMIIKSSEDYWYDFFKYQIQTLWENGEEWACL